MKHGTFNVIILYNFLILTFSARAQAQVTAATAGCVFTLAYLIPREGLLGNKLYVCVYVSLATVICVVVCRVESCVQ